MLLPILAHGSQIELRRSERHVLAMQLEITLREHHPHSCSEAIIARVGFLQRQHHAGNLPGEQVLGRW